MSAVLAVALGGALGALGRYWVSAQSLHWFGPGFPWGTLGVNLLGSVLIGIVVEALALRFSASQELRLFIVTGLLGGFTTFSAFSLEVANMIERRDLLLAGAYAGGSVVLGVAGLFLGLALMRAMLT